MQSIFRRVREVLKDDSNEMDTASLLLCNGLQTPVELFGQVDECADCALESLSNGPVGGLAFENITELTLTTSYAFRLELRPYALDASASRSTPPPAFEPCRFHEHLEEYGSYVLNVGHHPKCGALAPSNSSNESFCEWRQVQAGSSSLLPLVVLLGATLIGLPLLFQFVRVLLRIVALCSPAIHSKICSAARFLADPHASSSANSSGRAAGGDGIAAHEGGQQKTGRVRVLSVDVLRGAAIAVMIFANYGSGAYAGLNHAIWNGIHVADWACPCFVFVMGLSIAITNRRDAHRMREAIFSSPSDSLQLPLNFGLPAFGGGAVSRATRVRRAAAEFGKLVYRIGRRSLLLFLIGVSLSNVGFVDFASLRIFGVLQRLSLTYLFTSLATLPVFLEYAPPDAAGSGLSNGVLWDVTRFWPEWIPVLLFAGLQTGLEYGINPANWEVPSVATMKTCPRGYLGPGGLHWNRSYETCTGGAHRLLDLWLLGDKHMEPYPTTIMVYQTTVPFDDNALLGTCCSVLLCFLGLQAGKVLLFSRSDRERAVRWTVWAVIFALLTLPLVLIPSPYHFNASLLPINKNLWTASFSLAMAAIDTTLLALLYFLVDFRPTKSSDETGHELFGEAEPSLFTRLFGPRWPLWSGAPLAFLGANPFLIYVAHEVFETYLPVTLLLFLPDSHWGHLAQTIWGVAFWTLVAYVLYRKKIFLTI